MKKNLPITDNCVSFATDEEIISTTNLKGMITSVNDTFVRVSGFSREELIGKSHNMVRHPDMPAAAFEDMWTHLKAGKHWMGMVKNRCKNGDYYWVDAYVTPIFENGEVTGYESVRVALSEQRAKRAEKMYQDLNQGKKRSFSISQFPLEYRLVAANIGALLLGSIVTLSAFADKIHLAGMLTLAGSALIAFYVFNKALFHPINQAKKDSEEDTTNPLTVSLYTGRSDELGQVQLSEYFIKAKLRTVLGRIRNLAIDIEDNAKQSTSSLNEVSSLAHHQDEKSAQVSQTMKDMANSVLKVADSAKYAAERAQDSDQYSQQGASQASGAAQGIAKLTQAVSDVEKVISQLVVDTENIGSVIDVIKSIAEQTNLLALNAAIEAARAGEQGRGFAVVADEVRTLAGRTQASTEEINGLIEKLNGAVTQAVKVMEVTKAEAVESENNVADSIQSIQNIAGQVSGLSELNSRIVQEVIEQQNQSERINNNVEEIEQATSQVSQGVEVAMSIASSLSKKSHHMRDMVERFKQE